MTRDPWVEGALAALEMAEATSIEEVRRQLLKPDRLPTTAYVSRLNFGKDDVRIQRALDRAGIETIAEVLELGTDGLRGEVRMFGPKYIQIIKRTLWGVGHLLS